MATDTTRERLLCAAIDVFAKQGYEGASTRDICLAAAVGNASIHYHFGDKAAIYRELFVRLLDNFEERIRSAHVESLTGRDALLCYYRALLRPLSEDPGLAQQVYLHVREEFQPTGVVDDLLPRALQIQFDVLGDFLMRELSVRKLDVRLQGLVLGLHGVSFVYVVQRRSIVVALPACMEGAQWFNRLTAHIADMGWSMVEAERQRRKTATHIKPKATE